MQLYDKLDSEDVDIEDEMYNNECLNLLLEESIIRTINTRTYIQNISDRLPVSEIQETQKKDK